MKRRKSGVTLAKFNRTDPPVRTPSYCCTNCVLCTKIARSLSSLPPAESSHVYKVMHVVYRAFTTCRNTRYIPIEYTYAAAKRYYLLVENEGVGMQKGRGRGGVNLFSSADPLR